MIELLGSWLTMLEANPMMFSIFGTTIFGFILYICKDLPKNIYWFLLDCFTIKLEIIQDDNHEAYRCVEYTLNDKKLFYITGRFQLIYKWITKKLELCCGENSLYLTKLNGIWALISKHTDTNVQFWHSFYYEIRFFTRKKEKLENFFIKKHNEQKSLSEFEEIKIFQWINNSWDNLIKKKIDAPILLNNQKSLVCEKIAYFLNNEEKYIKKNMPYREGFIFYGDPGCGKSYFIHQLASIFDLNIYYLNINSFSNDNEFIKAILQMNQPSIMLIEDIDCNENLHNRNNATKTKKDKMKDLSKKENNTDEDKKTGISLSTVLNVFDGMLSQDGQITIITSNHFDKLDPALIRAGRFNTKLKFEKLKNKEIIKFINNYYDSNINDIQIEEISIAELSGICSNKNTVEELLNYINPKILINK